MRRFNINFVWFLALVPLFLMTNQLLRGYFIPKSSLLKKSSGITLPIAGGRIDFWFLCLMAHQDLLVI